MINNIISEQDVYANPLKSLRLYMIASEQPYYIPQIIPKLEAEGLYLAVNLLQAKQKQSYECQPLSVIRNQINDKKNQCQIDRNLQNRNNLKTHLIELANIYLKYGDIQEAYAQYFKAHENNSTQEALDYAIPWGTCMVLSNNYTHFKVINVNPNDPDQVGFQKYTLISAIRNYVRMDYKNFLNEILSIDSTLLTSVDFITCYKDLSRYFAIACLITKLPKDIVELLQNPFISKIIDEDPKIEELLNYYIDYDFVKLFQKVVNVVNELNRDIISIPILDKIKEKVINTILKQYIINFRRISIQSLSCLLNISENSVIAMVIKLIKGENLNYVIDPVDQIIIEKYTPQQFQLQQSKQLSETIIKAIDQKYIQCLRTTLISKQQQQQL